MSAAIIMLLSVVQGLTEFLPVSSSGHLWIVRWLTGYEPDLLFDVVVHVGTLAAVAICFRRDIASLFRSPGGRRTSGLIILASIPTACIGLGLKSFVAEADYGAFFIGFMLIVTGVLLLLADRLSAAPGREGEAGWNITWKQALVVGIVQGLAVIPGISRSGATIAAGLLLGVERREAYRFAFILSIPAISGAFLLNVLEMPSPAALFNPSMGGALVVSAVVGLLSLKLLRRMVVDKRRLYLFSLYLWLVGAALMAASLYSAV